MYRKKILSVIKRIFECMGVGMGIFGLVKAFNFATEGALVSGGFAAALTFMIRIQLEIYFSDDDRFRVGDDKGGGSALQGILSAKHSILLTHFSTEIPDKVYLEALKKKILEGICVTRLVSKQGAESSKYDWLIEFEELSKKTDNEYRQYDLLDCKAPFNFIVIDQESSWIYFPVESRSTVFRKCLKFNNPQVAKLLGNTFDWLKDNTTSTRV